MRNRKPWLFNSTITLSALSLVLAVSAAPVFAAEDELDLIIVPGVAFDHAGHRIGRGGGFYDRLLPQYRAVRVGICFGFQYLETIPAQEHDIRMDWVVTETGILKIELNS